MLLDHIGASLFLAYYVGHGFSAAQHATYRVLRSVGRTAFPIYIFLLVEGIRHTRSKPRYALRLLCFALLSEIPFDLAFDRRIYDPSSQNVYWTLLIGLLVVWGMVVVRRSLLPHRVLICVLDAALILAGCLTAWQLHTDYGYVGVLAISVAYLLRRYPLPQILLTCLTLLLSSASEWFALLAALPVAFYNGRRGRQHRFFFYLYYPAHLLLLYLILHLMGWG